MKRNWISSSYNTMLTFKNENKMSETYKIEKNKQTINWIIFEFQSNCILNQLMSEEWCVELVTLTMMKTKQNEIKNISIRNSECNTTVCVMDVWKLKWA